MNNSTKKLDSENPTVGHASKIDRKANKIFQSWVPDDWLPRKEDPDVHIDYSIEVVSNGTPTGRIFRVQIKGRCFYSQKAKNPSVSLKTKHLRYYLTCREPVFIFLIDPIVGKGYWIFIQRYLLAHVQPAALGEQGKLTIPFDLNASLDSPELFERELNSAWHYMQNRFPGSPTAAIKAKKQELEQLDPRYSVQIAANAEKMQIHLQPIQPLTPPKFIFQNKDGENTSKTLFENGQSFQLDVNEIQTDDAPILKKLLSELDDTKIQITHGTKFNGCLQLLFLFRNEPVFIQIDGEWIVDPPKAAFKSRFNGFPVEAEYLRAENPKNNRLTLKFDWNLWVGQPLQSLSYFEEVNAFFQCNDFSIQCFINGNKMAKKETFSLDGSLRKEGLKKLIWLDRCRKAVQYCHVNPIYAAQEELDKIVPDDFQLLVPLVEQGTYEQCNAEQFCSMSIDFPSDLASCPPQADAIEMPNQIRTLNLFGMCIPLGPLTYTWTNLRLHSIHPLDGHRRELIWKGEAQSIFRIEYKRSTNSPNF